MLDVETKNRINTARDILVGKVPDPKSQVEQITIALIYKFMDDMDVESEEMGGKRTFFVGEYAKYAWRKIFDPRQSGYELLNLYSEAITKMDTNPGVPKLFRDIFKNAYLPYRDPETLKSFLKIINDFEYSHSEKLGDAFEFLLSILGSQGDAGQFRTPRHIIDFMVEIIDPKKHEVILDPACGTAGFLISSYKHIVKQNSSNYLPEQKSGITGNGTQSVNEVIITTNGYSGDKLTADERRIIADNIHGYDISPDMVRLSLVNMYLHGIKEPHISEYDTLTSEDHWNQYCDVILANPPFMSPKGGIRPHKRFSVPSNRSEVLFVDYIAEHLTPDGRAIVIVPEGIIFQSGTAYKNLRKMLVEKYLVGVISLPAGVFNPYSGVKTSILWLDKSLAKKTDKILFIKIENDGFDLGAQRRAIRGNDLPAAIHQISVFKNKIIHGKQIDFELEVNISLIRRNEISDNGDYNLSGERFKKNIITKSDFEMLELWEVCLNITDGSHFSPQTTSEGYPYITVKDLKDGLIDFAGCKVINEKDFNDLVHNGCKPILNDVLFSKDGTVGKTAFINFERDFVVLSSLAIIRPNPNKIIPKYLYTILSTDAFIKKAVDNKTGVAIRRIVLKTLKRIKIPIPPLSIQEEIATEIDNYQKIIDGARQVVNNYKARIDIDPEWEMVELGSLVKINNGRVLTEFDDHGSVACIKVSDMNIVSNQYEIVTTNHWLKETSFPLLPVGTILFPKRGAAIATNKKRITKIPCLIDNNCMGLISHNINTLVPEYLFYYLLGFDLTTISNSAGIALINNGDIASILIPLPEISTQRVIVESLQKERGFINSTLALMRLYEQKIKDRIAKLWGE